MLRLLVTNMLLLFFFFKQKTAYEMRISDWSSDVCSSDLADAVVLSALDSIAWALNVRGGDVAHTPVALAYAIVSADGTADLYVAPDKLTDAVRQHLGHAVRLDRKSVVKGKSVSVRVDLGGSRLLKKKSTS